MNRLKTLGIVRFAAILILLGCFWGKGSLHAQNVEKDSTLWAGEWADDGNLQYSFFLHLYPGKNGGMTGYFEWRLIWTSLPEHKSKVGAAAKESLLGVYDPTQKLINLRGYRQEDPADIISMDTYQIHITENGTKIEGVNIKPENYHGSLFGIKIPPKKPVVEVAKVTIRPATDNEKIAETKSKLETPPPSEKKKEVSKTESKFSDPVVVVPAATPKVPDAELGSREIVTKEEFKGAETQVRIRIYDKSMIDGDVLSLNWNGKWILRYYKISGTPKEIVLDLQKGENNLVMFAENLGRYPPNTAAIAVIRGGKTQEIILNSDMGKSEAIKIVRQ